MSKDQKNGKEIPGSGYKVTSAWLCPGFAEVKGCQKMANTGSKGEFSAYFHMPTALFDWDTVSFCAKDVINDDVIDCVTSTNSVYLLDRHD